MKKRLLLIEIVLYSLFDKVYAVNKISCGTASGIPEALPEFIRTIITLIKYLVPLGLILFGSVDLLKVVFSEDKKGLDKAVKKFLIRSAAGVIVFFIIFMTTLFFENLDNSETTVECIRCFAVDKKYCVLYYETEEDHSKEKEEDNKMREELEKKREKYRKENENDADKEKKLAAQEKDPDSVLNGSRTNVGTGVNGGEYSNIDYVNWAIGICKDESIGYGHTYPYQRNNGETVYSGGANVGDGISCSGLVGLAITNSNFGVSFLSGSRDVWPYIGISPEFKSRLQQAGFQRVYPSSDADLKTGDIFILPNDSHTGIISGPGRVAEAMGPPGPAGDSTGYEVLEHASSYHYNSFAEVYRLPDEIMQKHIKAGGLNGSGSSYTSSKTGITYNIYNQADSRWGGKTYSDGKTVAHRGCMITSSAVVSSGANSSITPADVYSRFLHTTPSSAIPQLTNNQFSCYNGSTSKSSIINYLNEGKVVVVRVWGSSNGGSSSFTSSQHYMALLDIDSSNSKVFVGNSYGSASGHSASDWFNIDEVLTSIQEAELCTPSQSIMR